MSEEDKNLIKEFMASPRFVLGKTAVRILYLLCQRVFNKELNDET